MKNTAAIIALLVTSLVSLTASADPVVNNAGNVMVFKADTITAKRPVVRKCRVVALQQGSGTVKICD